MNGLFENEQTALTARFALMCFMAAVNGFNIRTEKINLFSGLKNNKLFVRITISIIIGVILACTLLGNAIKVCPLSLKQWLAVALLSLIVIPIDIVRKLIVKAKNKKNN